MPSAEFTVVGLKLLVVATGAVPTPPTKDASIELSANVGVGVTVELNPTELALFGS